jgi:hypothetical protein
MNKELVKNLMVKILCVWAFIVLIMGQKWMWMSLIDALCDLL